MALTYVTQWTTQNRYVSDTITSASQSFVAGELVTVLWCQENYGTTLTISNTGTAQTWTKLVDLNGDGHCRTVLWSCVMSTSQSMTISVQDDTLSTYATAMCVIRHAGQHATTPIPAGKIYSGQSSGTDISQSITPTSSGSCLWMIAGDWNNGTDTFAAIANCTKEHSFAYTGAFATCIIRPDTQPRTDANAFTIGETDTGGKISWIAFEVQAAEASGEVFTQTAGDAFELADDLAPEVFFPDEHFDPIKIPQPLPGALGVYRSIRGRVG